MNNSNDTIENRTHDFPNCSNQLRHCVLACMHVCTYVYVRTHVCMCVYMYLFTYVTKVMRISRQPSPVTITIDQKQLENLKCFKYLGSMLTDDGRCTCEIKSRISMAKAAFNKKKNLFTSKLDLNLRKKLVKCYVLEHGCVWC